MLFLNGVNSIPLHLEINEDFNTFDQMMFTLTSSIVKGTPRWS